MPTLKEIKEKLQKAWKGQPEIVVYQPLPEINPEPEPFKLEGHILRCDTTERKITRAGNSYHLTFPPEWRKALNEKVKYAGLFHAQGRVGLIFVCEGGIHG